MQPFYVCTSPKWKRWLGIASYHTTRMYTCGPVGIYPECRVRHGLGSLDVDGTLFVLPGYEFAPTGPVPDTHEMVMGSCAHDMLYAMGELGSLPPGWRAKADAYLRKQMHNGADNIFEKGYAYVAWCGVRALYWPARGLKTAWNWF